MALNKTGLKNALVAAFSKERTSSNVNAVATEIANAVEDFVKSGTVKTTVSTPNKTTGTGIGNII